MPLLLAGRPARRACAAPSREGAAPSRRTLSTVVTAALAACAFALPLLQTPALAAEATTPAQAPAQPPATPAAAPQPRALTLQDSIAIALQENRSIQIAEDRLSRAQAGVSAAAAPGRLQANARASITRNDEATSMTLAGANGQPARSIDITPLYSRTAALVVTQPIDISGAIRAARSIAGYGAVSAELDIRRTREQTIQDVKTAFFQVLRAQASLGVAQANLGSLEEHLRQAQQFYTAGVVAQFDVLRAETAVANARQSVIAARNGVELAKSALNNAMGIDVTTPLALRYEEPVKVAIPDYRPSVATAYEQRPEMLQARVNIEAARAGISQARAGGRPSLALTLNTNATADGGAFSPRSVTWNAVAAISYPFLEGGLTRARVKQAQADVAAAQVTEEQTREGVALDVQQAILSMTEAAERMAAATKGVEQAKESLRLATIRYREGVSTSLEVTDAQSALTQAESNLVNARYDYLVARGRYERAIGSAAGDVTAGTTPAPAPGGAAGQPAAPAKPAAAEATK